MHCEVCGRKIRGKGRKALIEGAELVVCNSCAPLGSLSWEIRTTRPLKPRALQKRSQPQKKVAAKPSSPLEPSNEVVEDFGARIRQAREAKGLSLEDLGRKINEKVSLLKKLESKRIKPNHRLAQKLQYALKIELLVPVAEGRIPTTLLSKATASKAVTLGDLLAKKAKAEEKK